MTHATEDNMESWCIRPITLADAPALLRFYQTASAGVRAFFEPFGAGAKVTEAHIAESLRKTAAGRNIDFGVMGADGSLAGHGFIWAIDTPKPVFGIGLHEYLHGQGWGRRLMQTVLQAADEKRLPLITLTVLKANQKAKALYETLGFVLAGEASFREKNDSWYMERRRKEQGIPPE